MGKASVIGLDLAKNIFQVHGVDEQGNTLVRKTLRRSQVQPYFAQLPPCLVGLEACGGAHVWCSLLSKLGHTVRLMAPQFVKPYVKSNKNDRNDAEAICEAVQRPSMRFVTPKTVEQQAVLHAHHSRQLLVRQRVAITNHLRGVLLEYNVAITPGDKALRRPIPELLEDGDNALPMLTRILLSELKDQYEEVQARIARLEAQLQEWMASSPLAQRLVTIPGIGPLTATALAANIGDGQHFQNARQLAAYLGLVPRQASSGGREKLLGISKRGDGYLRWLLIHGARAVISHVRRRLKAGKEGGNPWVEQLLVRCHVNEVAVALANKMARIVWVVATRDESYRPRPIETAVSAC